SVVVDGVNQGAISSYTFSNVTSGHSISATFAVIPPTPDTTAPVITLNGSTPVQVTVGGTYTELGASVTDNVDAPSVATVSGSVTTNATGTYTITYTATDLAGNVATPVTRTVNVVDAVIPPTPDTTAPVITLNGSTPVQVTVGGTYTELGASVTDNVD
ncbi:MAG: DUF5011 domain-containing protein, partial [Candidatus Pacebacteria bacterium]|nr:DUF5011 domain-containing protein [Candidatus Paceibacterota bacterium]